MLFTSASPWDHVRGIVGEPSLSLLSREARALKRRHCCYTERSSLFIQNVWMLKMLHVQIVTNSTLHFIGWMNSLQNMWGTDINSWTYVILILSLTLSNTEYAVNRTTERVGRSYINQILQSNNVMRCYLKAHQSLCANDTQHNPSSQMGFIPLSIILVMFSLFRIYYKHF